MILVMVMMTMLTMMAMMVMMVMMAMTVTIALMFWLRAKGSLGQSLSVQTHELLAPLAEAAS